MLKRAGVTLSAPWYWTLGLCQRRRCHRTATALRESSVAHFRAPTFDDIVHGAIVAEKHVAAWLKPLPPGHSSMTHQPPGARETRCTLENLSGRGILAHEAGEFRAARRPGHLLAQRDRVGRGPGQGGKTRQSMLRD